MSDDRTGNESEFTNPVTLVGAGEEASSALQDLRHRADLLWAALLHETGVVIVQEGEERFSDQGEIGALAAGAFHSTAMLGNRLGDRNVEGLCYEGKHQSFLILPVDATHLLLAVFPSACKPGVVRLCMQRCAASLRGESEIGERGLEPVGASDWLGA